MNTLHRGFARMNEKKQKEIARKGGRVAHEEGKAHEFSQEEARVAGTKGGKTTASEHRNDDFYHDIGIKGGQKRKATLGRAGYQALGRKGGEAKKDHRFSK